VVTRRQLIPMISRFPSMMDSLYVTISFAFGGLFFHPEDTSQLAVVATGSASPLFAQTGAPDRTSITPSGEGAPHNNSVNVQDLPNLLFPPRLAAQPNAGSTCWQVHNPSGEVSPCTEDGIFATMGLATSSQAGPAARLDSAARRWPLRKCRVAARSGSASLRRVQGLIGADWIEELNR